MQKHLLNFFTVVVMMAFPWVVQGQVFNYICDFDNNSDTAGWVFENGSQTNKWFIGSATHNSGTKSLYISNDNGTSNTYNALNVSFVYAYQEFTLDTGYYSISYDWKCYGEGNYDYLRVFLAPDSATLTAGLTPSGGTNAYGWSSAALPSGFISLTDSSTTLNLQSSWQSLFTNFTIHTAGSYHLVFAWANDNMSGTQPPAAIDNIQFEYIGCPPVESLSVSNITQTSAHITWIDTFNSTFWTVEYGVGGFAVGTGTSMVAYNTNVTLTGLTPDTSYDVYVTPICTIGDTTTAHISFRTIGCPPVENLSASNITHSTANITWADTFNTTFWTVEYGVGGFAVGTGTSIVAYTTNATLTGLTPNTPYDVYVTPNCSIGNAISALVTFRTTCALIDSLPWYDDLESYSISSFDDYNPPCYHRLNNGTQRDIPYLSSHNTSHNHTPDGSQGLYWQTDFSNPTFYGNYQCIILPSIDTSFDANALQLNFWAKATSSGTPTLKVGVMTDPDNISSFVSVDTVSLTSSVWQEVSTPLSAYTGNGHYVAIKADAVLSSDNWSAAIDDITLDYITTCHIPETVYGTSATDSSITLDWVDIDPAIAWQVEYGPKDFTEGSSLITTSHPVTINGLSPLSQYDFYVLPICTEGDTARWPRWREPTTFATTICETNLIVATGDDTSTGTSYYYPVNNWYNYTLTETIIDSAELDGAMNIEYISYYYDYATDMTRKDNCTIYFQPTTLSTFSSTADAVALNPATAVMVYTGPLNFSQGWNYLLLDNAYYYDGIGNLLVIVDDDSRKFHHSGYVFKTQPCSGNKTFYCYSDTYNPDITNPLYYPLHMGVDSSRVVMQLITCSLPPCDAPTDIYTIVDSNAVTVGWSSYMGSNSFEIEYGPHGFSHGTGKIDTTTSSPITLSGFDYATEYDIYVRALCDHGIYSEWSIVTSFTTLTAGISNVIGTNCTIHPNPTNGSTTITVSGVSGKVGISVVDVDGREVASETLECPGGYAKSVNVDRLAQGAYFVRITGENVSMVKKLIVR